MDTPPQIRGDVIVVTGAGGSIGSALAASIAVSKPAALVLIDRAETPLFWVHHDLTAAHPDLPIHPVVASIEHKGALDPIFSRHAPRHVFHAAAHKHVALMELNPREAILNTVGAMREAARASIAHEVESFVLVSTDKAVRPASVMGATKRVCEQIGLAHHTLQPHTAFCAVRFGNVRGSSGSVLPIFEKQLKQGRPLTVTHPEMKRYFIDIDRAIGAILDAASISTGGEIFVARMGEPLSIEQLATTLIAARHLDESAQIIHTSPRPGEKLTEELALAADALVPSKAASLFRAEGDVLLPGSFSLEAVDALLDAARDHQSETWREHLERLVPEATLQGEGR